MQGIGGFLERYKDFAAPRIAAARAVRTAIKETLGIEVEEKNVSIKNGRAAINVDGLSKTEILLHKETILTALRSKIGAAVSDLG